MPEAKSTASKPKKEPVTISENRPHGRSNETPAPPPRIKMDVHNRQGPRAKNEPRPYPRHAQRVIITCAEVLAAWAGSLKGLAGPGARWIDRVPRCCPGTRSGLEAAQVRGKRQSCCQSLLVGMGERLGIREQVGRTAA